MLNHKLESKQNKREGTGVENGRNERSSVNRRGKKGIYEKPNELKKTSRIVMS